MLPFLQMDTETSGNNLILRINTVLMCGNPNPYANRAACHVGYLDEF